MNTFLAFNLNSKLIEYVLLDIDLVVLHEEKIILKSNDATELLDETRKIILSHWNKSVHKHSNTNEYNLVGVGISTAGIVDVDSNVVLHTNGTISNYSNINLKNILNIPDSIVFVCENDINSQMLFYQNTSSDVKVNNCALISLDNAVGAAVSMNGKIIRGHNYLCGEIGYIKQDDMYIEQLLSDENIGNEKYIDNLVNLIQTIYFIIAPMKFIISCSSITSEVLKEDYIITKLNEKKELPDMSNVKISLVNNIDYICCYGIAFKLVESFNEKFDGFVG